MDLEELFDLLEVEGIDDFSYFEHFSSLIECDEEIPFDLFFKVLAGLDTDTLVELTDNYLEDVLSGVPDDQIDFYTLLSTVRQALLGLARASLSREDRRSYAEELFRFRNWYIFDSVVLSRRHSDNKKLQISISEALTLSRLEKLNEEQYTFDFSEAMDYDIDEYSILMDSAIDEEYDDILEEDEELYEDGLIDREFPVIDGEDFDEYDEDEELY